LHAGRRFGQIRPQHAQMLISMTVSVPINGQQVRETFRAWHAEQESLDAQLSESLAALGAYQSHLDAWQQQLARERDQLNLLREQCDRDRALIEKNQPGASAESAADLQAAREKIAALTASLLSRTEELRASDNRRAEVVTELELGRNREYELRIALDEQKRTIEQERVHWAEEFARLRELLERQLESERNAGRAVAADHGSDPAQPPPPAVVKSATKNESAVLGSIVEQFGKLRQQRAIDRQAQKRSR